MWRWQSQWKLIFFSYLGTRSSLWVYLIKLWNMKGSNCKRMQCMHRQPYETLYIFYRQQFQILFAVHSSTFVIRMQQMPHKNSGEQIKFNLPFCCQFIYLFALLAFGRECKCMMGASDGFYCCRFYDFFWNEKVHRHRMYRSMHKQWHTSEKRNSVWKENEFFYYSRSFSML